MNLWRKFLLFYLGGCAYVGLELLWRGRSHGSMFVAGGLCFVLIGMQPRIPLPLRALAGALTITTVELGMGLLVNREFVVWDYRAQPGNFLGQICPMFSLLWIPVSIMAIWLYDRIDQSVAQLCCGNGH